MELNRKNEEKRLVADAAIFNPGSHILLRGQRAYTSMSQNLGTYYYHSTQSPTSICEHKTV